ncbi:TetR/AcrR family transcriptional regulator [Actinomadura craniellae]|uniref:TetR/AcrR family transcriptional regulator n=1 Tax=Actinomadura craniellae TaxID=2231787 RepID=A0A365H4Z3_9ACTN|nr:WHG domain-containing protein [Actinomadura craniellae]RAY13293.1 TetR/AcrR family transcriptional regulator [Actinomadura craniellae]
MAETRRDRLRAATVREITGTARRILVEQGPDAVTLRAIAREMGMTAPALYRYFDSHHELLQHLIADVFTELTDDITTALHGLGQVDMAVKFVTAAREFRRWSLGHPREYALIFGTPMPGLYVETADIAAECGRRFGWTFLRLFMELWQKRPFPVPADEEIDPRLREQLRTYRDGLGVSLPLGTMLTYLQCWVRLQGAVSLEVFGHLAFALDDAEPLFDMMLADLAPMLGLEYPPPE